jgi:hypothetical protein
MNTICRRGIAAAFSFAVGFGVPAVASAQQQAPDAQVQQNAPAQQATPAKPGPGMGQRMMPDGMEHGKMGRKEMEGEHGRMGPRMNQGSSAPSTDSSATTGASPSTNSNTTPPTGSK